MTENTPHSITITPIFLADLHVEGERMPMELTEVVTYDLRLAAAARGAGLEVQSPA